MSIKKKVKNYNVLIEEGLRTRQMYPTDILKVDNTDSTDSLWMPQDNANYGNLYASENGIYIAARDGYDAYNEVDVRVTFDDFSDLDFDDLDSTWDLDSLDDLVIDEDLDIDEFDDLFNNEDLWDDPFDKIDSSFDDRVKGIDPVSGNEYAVGLDANGYLDEYLLPSKIKIVKFPNKTTYLHNEKIDYTGIVVMAFTEDDKVWKNEQYQNGVIPFEELIFPVETADATIAENIKYARSSLNTETIEQPIPFAINTLVYGDYDSYNTYTHSYSGFRKTLYLKDKSKWADKEMDIVATGTLISQEQIDSGDHHGSYTVILFASKNKIVKVGIIWRNDDGSSDYFYYPERSDENIWSYTYQDKTVYFAEVDTGVSETDGFMIPEAGPGTLNDNAREHDLWNTDVLNHMGKVAWTIVYGDITGGVQQIPVQWKRPDGEILETSFFINVSFINETLPDYEWNIIDPTIDPHDIPETPEGEVTPEVEVTP
jgi:hypothetical protein